MNLFRSACSLLLVTAAACGAPETPDTADAGPCQGGLPGVKLTFEGPVSPYSGGADLDVVIGSVQARYPGELYLHYESGVPSAALPYPPGTLAGPGSVDYYYPGPGIINTIGHADFQADPSACVTVSLTLTQMGPSDASVLDAAP